MKIELTKPAPGTPISASLICAIIDELKRLRLIETPGVRFGRSPSGTRIFIDQNRLSASSGVHGCFDIRQPKTNGDDDPGGFDNPYFIVGSRMKYMPSAKNSNIIKRSAGKFVGISYQFDDNEEFEAHLKTVEELSTANEDPYVVFMPLYKVNSNGTGAEVDFRIIPTVRIWDKASQ